ncbi:MAG: hypothetical protein WBV93_19495, partial [Anaerobacillus sp.]
MKSMKYILLILLAIAIASPLSLYISFFCETIFNRAFGIEKNYTDVVSSLIVIPFFFAYFYIIFGLPTTLIADGIVKLKPISNYTASTRCIIQFVIYTLAGLSLAFDSGFDPNSISFVLVPVYT